jgi:hypothetical protein
LRNWIISRANRRKSLFFSASAQSTQLVSLSWHQALLFPFWVRRNSSPARTIGTPWESMSVAKKFFACRTRRARIAGSVVSPSAPQFHDRFSSHPSRLDSPFSSLCFEL